MRFIISCSVNNLGKELKKEINAGSVAYDLPKQHKLRLEMESNEKNLKEKLSEWSPELRNNMPHEYSLQT